MAAYFMGAVEITDAAGFQKYAEAGFGSMDGFNFEVVALDDSPLLLEGELPAHHLVILKFDSKDEIARWYNSQAYTKVKPLRHASSKTPFLVGIEGYPG